MEFLFQHTSRVPAKNIQQAIGRLSFYHKTLRGVVKRGGFSSPESSLNLPNDTVVFKYVQSLIKKTVTPRLKYLLVIGIGGSNLGTKAVYDAFRRSEDFLSYETSPQLVFVDTCDSKWLTLLKDFCEHRLGSSDEILINIISKSGKTMETLVNADILLHTLRDRYQDLRERVVLTTDEGSSLWRAGEEQGMHLLPIPHFVGGRYSVLSAVGLFPLAAVGIDVSALWRGARHMRDACLSSEKNSAAQSAAIRFYAYRKGWRIQNAFLFHPELESLGKWYRQLLAESIGKERDQEGNFVRIDLTPTVAIGSTDLHSMSQLYLGATRTTFTTFITTKPTFRGIRMPKSSFFPELTSALSQRSVNEISQAIAQGVMQAYSKRGLPFSQIILSNISAFSLGEYLQFSMLETMYLAKLFHVNAFDQPQVELYKKEAAHILTHL